MCSDLPELAQERDIHRGYIFSLAGFSFTAVTGLLVLEASIKIKLQLAIWFVLISFLAFIASLNLQSYKSTRWQNQLATSLQESGTLSLVLALCSLLISSSFDPVFQWVAVLLSGLTWSVDHCVRLWLEHRYLNEVDLALRGREQQ